MNLPQIRVIIDNESVMVDTMDQANALADERQLDLVEVAPNVYKVMDYKKHLYNQQKMAKSNKQANKQETKEAQFNIGIAENDMQRKIRDISKWLQQGAQVRVMVRLRGREQSRPEIGYNMMQRILDGIADNNIQIAKPTIKLPEGGRDITTVLKIAK